MSVLLDVLSYVSLSLDSGLIIIPLLDLSAAFDTANHNVPLVRVSEPGISGTGISWFKSNLSHRHFFIRWIITFLMLPC